MASPKQIGSLLDKSFSKWNYKKAIRLSDNESKTRDYLIEPFFNLLGYDKMEHYSHEFSLRLSKGHVKNLSPWGGSAPQTSPISHPPAS